MATGYVVFGPGVCKVTTGSAGARETLGVFENDVRLPLDVKLGPVRSSAGGEEPVDYQHMGRSVRLSIPMSHIDEAVLAKLRYRGSGGTTEGVALPPGRLVGTNGDHFKLILAGAYGNPYRFYYATLQGAQDISLGTKYSVYQMNFLCWCFVPGTAATAAGIQWWDRTDGD